MSLTTQHQTVTSDVLHLHDAFEAQIEVAWQALADRGFDL